MSNYKDNEDYEDDEYDPESTDKPIKVDKNHELWAEISLTTVKDVEMACGILSEDEENEEAMTVVTRYVVREFGEKGISFSEDDVLSRVKEIIVTHSIRELEAKGLVETEIDENGDFVHSLTAKGKRWQKRQ